MTPFRTVGTFSANRSDFALHPTFAPGRSKGQGHNVGELSNGHYDKKNHPVLRFRITPGHSAKISITIAGSFPWRLFANTAVQ